MDANTQIGDIDKFVIKTTTPTLQDMETTLNKNFVPNSEATYQQVDTAARALIELSNNGYTDTICVTNISVNEVLAG